MGMARLVLGLVRDAVVPGIQPDKRDRARRVLRRLAREHLRPEDLRQQRVRPVEGELFPSSWRDQGPAGTSGVAVVILSDRADADPLLAALRRGGIDPDVFVVHHESHSRSGAQVVAAPAEWGVAARLIALVNSGRLDPYQRLVVVSYDSSTIAGYACAALNALTCPPAMEVRCVGRSQSLHVSSLVGGCGRGRVREVPPAPDRLHQRVERVGRGRGAGTKRPVRTVLLARHPRCRSIT